jgi:uncharacterized damage-inducible protein DinB
MMNVPSAARQAILLRRRAPSGDNGRMEAMSRQFLEVSRQELAEMRPRLRQVVVSLTQEQVWWRPNENSNSVGNLLLHLNGNVSQWLLRGLGGRAYERQRAAEFAERAALPAAALLDTLERTLAQADEVLGALAEADLLRVVTIQGYTVTGAKAIYHVVSHFALHYGQILYLAKAMQNRSLGFYAHLDPPAPATG